jgi:tetratricopeptide (TPR) repeat protein
MSWPQSVDYNSAIQNPPACFADAELARCQPAEGMMPGIPLSYAGNFATVYKMVDAFGAAWAVKCFTRRIENLQLRYKKISEHLNRRKRRFVVDFHYLAEGIRVAGAWYPVVKMQWVEGFTLNEFLRDRAGQVALLEQLCQLWLRLGNDMREDRVGHGDLQHGNVLLVPGSSATSMLLRLVDYDGMWVPALADLPPGEVGHANYQHPQRPAEGAYDDQIDRFAQLAIYTALRCLMVGGKALWTEYDNGENLLFREADFKLPGNSRLFPKLLALPDAATATLAGHLLLASQSPLGQVPLVNDLLDGATVAPLRAEQLDRIRSLVPSMPAPVLLLGAAPTLPEVNLAAERSTETDLPTLPKWLSSAELQGVSPEQRRIAAEWFAHAQEVLGKGDASYALELLQSCCKLDPAKIEYRKLLREIAWEGDRGQRPGWWGRLANLPLRRRLGTARRVKDFRKVLEFGEELLTRLPADVQTQLDMADAAEALRLFPLAVWLLQQARERIPANQSSLCSRFDERLDQLARVVPFRNAVSEGLLPDWAHPPSGPPHIPPSPSPGGASPRLWIGCPADPAIIAPEQRQMAADIYTRAVQVLDKGDPFYARELLLSCCKLDPGNISYRQGLRDAGRQVRAAHRDDWAQSPGMGRARYSFRAARSAGDHRKVLEHGEELLARQPADVSAQIEMANAAESLGLCTLAIWLLEEAHDQVPNDLGVLRALARVCERDDHLDAALVVWERIHHMNPADRDAAARIKALCGNAGDHSPTVV